MDKKNMKAIRDLMVDRYGSAQVAKEWEITHERSPGFFLLVTPLKERPFAVELANTDE